MQNCPQDVRDLLDGIVRTFEECLGDALVGVYLHGSVAMGCYHGSGSDVDVLVVAERPLGVETERRVAEALVRLSGSGPGARLELSVLTRAALAGFVHPLPFELHFSPAWREEFLAGRAAPGTARRDADLAAHVTVTRRRGVVLRGEPTEAVFPDVPWAAYLDSIRRDAETSYGNIMGGPDDGTCRVPPYGVLNACRVTAAVEDGLVLSKREGGEWGLRRFGGEHRPVIAAALRAYGGAAAEQSVDAAALKAFVMAARLRWRGAHRPA